jgi:tripartite-type tricarboxylate transporter receptor subunit TctC
MKLPRRPFLHLAAGAAALAVLVALAGDAAWSQTAKTIKIVTPVPPGGSTDILARLLAEQIGRQRGPTAVIENRPGAGTVIGSEAVARAAPDGGTVLINTDSFLVSPHLRNLSYNPLTSFEAVCYLVRVPQVITVNSGSPYRTLADLLAAARAAPGNLTLASIGPATAAHIAFEMLKRAANVNITFVPYPGSAPAVSALLGDHVTAVIAGYPNVAELIRTGKLRALAVVPRQRIDALPDVPTVTESGFKDYSVENWQGLFAPAKTPKEALTQLAGWFSAAVKAPEIRDKLAVQGLFPVGTCGADFADLVRKQYEDYGRVIKDASIKAE